MFVYARILRIAWRHHVTVRDGEVTTVLALPTVTGTVSAILSPSHVDDGARGSQHNEDNIHHQQHQDEQRQQRQRETKHQRRQFKAVLDILLKPDNT